MGRIARVVIPGCPHHIIQRGNRRQTVFFQDNDKKFYLHLLNYHIKKENVAVWCYCLMNNHVHFIAVPPKPTSLAKAVGELHRKYTTTINIRNDWKGYLWQGRFLSYPMDDDHVYHAVRYIERNPVRAGLVNNAGDYSWSSAKAHINKEHDKLISDFYLLSDIKDWRSYLQQKETQEDQILIRKHAKSGRPLGSKKFIRKAEKITGRRLMKRKPGRQPKKNS
ncbi:MAG: transposase [Candidatus Aminicenantes bacterium]|nr:transposase [Candidatus Aminicenantes bacterium]